jgi:hypothetical protein
MIDSESQWHAMRLEGLRSRDCAASFGDSVLYHSLLRLASPQQVWGALSEMGTIYSSGLPTRSAPNDVPGPWRVYRY